MLRGTARSIIKQKWSHCESGMPIPKLKSLFAMLVLKLNGIPSCFVWLFRIPLFLVFISDHCIFVQIDSSHKIEMVPLSLVALSIGYKQQISDMRFVLRKVHYFTFLIKIHNFFGRSLQTSWQGRSEVVPWILISNQGLKNVASGSPGHVHFHAEQVTEGWTSRKEMGGGEFSAHKNFFWPIARARIFFLVESHAGTFLEGRGGGFASCVIGYLKNLLVKRFRVYPVI